MPRVCSRSEAGVPRWKKRGRSASPTGKSERFGRRDTLVSPFPNRPSSEDAVIDVGEQIVPPLDAVEPRLIDFVALDGLVEVIEVDDVQARAFLGVLDHGPRLEDEGPVAGLCQQQLAGGLVESATAQRRGIAVVAGQL